MTHVKSTLFSAIAIAVSVFILPTMAMANANCQFDNKFILSACERITHTYHDGNWDIYVTGLTWHGNGYTRERKKELNALAYGGGIGKRWSSDSRSEDLLYAFAFLDSHKAVEPIAGYAHQWLTKPIGPGPLLFGAGFTVALTARADTLHYFPFPVALPIAMVRFNRVSVMGTVIPKIANIGHGTVVFAWGRYSF